MSVTSASDPDGRPPDRRKLIAVLHADMVGYSRLIGLDDVGTLERLRTLRTTLIDPAIGEHGGRIVNTGGDSLLIVFDSTDGAVRCAMKVQQQVPACDGDQPFDRTIRFRVGINVGDVIPDGTDVHGDVVNVAARLQAECPPGGICVSRAVRDHVHYRLALAFEELGALNLKNISQPVEAFVLRLDSRGAFGTTAPAPTIPGLSFNKAPRLSIAVLPFLNLSGDPDQEYFAEGLTDDLTTYLSHIRGSFIIGRNTAFSYKGREVDARQVGKELSVRYVIAASVRRSGDVVRVNVHMIDTESGADVWTDSFDRRLVDVLQLQSDITARIAHTLGLALFDAESRRVLRTQGAIPEAVDLAMHGWSLINRPVNQANNLAALQILEEVVRLDPKSVRGLIGLALGHVRNVINQWSQDRKREVEIADDGISKALTIDPDNAFGHFVKGLIYRAQNRPEMSIMEYQAAIDLDPSLAHAYVQIGQSLMRLGQPKLAFDLVEKALQLSPRDPSRSIWLFVLGSAYLYDGQSELAIDTLHRASQADPAYTTTFALLAAAYMSVDRRMEAQHALRDLQRLAPAYTIQTYRMFALGDHPAFAAQVRRVCDALKAAGLNEQ
jgi:adenylate cyclase